MLAVADLATIGLAAPASAAPNGAACLGQVHETVNSDGLEGFDNVDQLVRGLGGGRAKNAAATAMCAED